MCGVLVRQSRTGRFKSISTYYCEDHPACCRLKGDLVRPDDVSRTAPVSPVTPPRTGSPGPSGRPVSAPLSANNATNNLINKSSGHGAGGRHIVFDEPLQRPEIPISPVTRLKRTMSSSTKTMQSRIAKLTMTPITARNHCCIRIGYVYCCGHPVRFDPPVRGHACSSKRCRHYNTTHFIGVPLAFPCSWTKRCNSGEVVKKTLLFKVTEAVPDWKCTVIEDKTIEYITIPRTRR